MKKTVLLILILLVFSFSAFSQGFSRASRFYDRGKSYQEREEYYNAIEQYQNAVSENPSYADAWFALAECSYATEEYNLALSYIDKAEVFVKNNAEYENLKGFCYIGLFELDKARKVFLDVLEKYPNNVDARFGLAELELFSGKVNQAEQWYEDALLRQNTNRKALLSLALISHDLGKTEETKRYIELAMEYYSGSPEVFYFASYLDMLDGNLDSAEGKARASIRLDSNYEKGWELLSIILYNSNRFDEVVALCNERLNKNRNLGYCWYMKAVALEAQNKVEPAIEAYTSGLQVFPTDEVMRSAMEKLVLEKIPPEDSRRKTWAEYHVKKALNNTELFYTDAALYEYRRSLTLSPFDTDVRKKYADLLFRNNLYESYLAQMKFIMQTDKSREVKEAVESYSSLLRTSLENRWGKNTLTLNKHRVTLGLYCFQQNPQLLHPELEYIISVALKDHFTSIPYFAISNNPEYVSGYTQAFRYARNSSEDYFALISAEESEREIAIEIKLYSGRTGNEAKSFKVYRTGNDRFANALLKTAEKLKEGFPLRGKILDRKDSVVLLDLGQYDGLKAEQVLTVVKNGRLNTLDSGIGLMCTQGDVYGTVKVTKVEENLSQGVFSRKGFYDRINIDDEVFLSVSTEGEEKDKKSPLEDDFEFSLTKPMLLDLVQNIKN